MELISYLLWFQIQEN